MPRKSMYLTKWSTSYHEEKEEYTSTFKKVSNMNKWTNLCESNSLELWMYHPLLCRFWMSLVEATKATDLIQDSLKIVKGIVVWLDPPFVCSLDGVEILWIQESQWWLIILCANHQKKRFVWKNSIGVATIAYPREEH